ncbi:MAG: hypothetical protein KAS87_05950 [Candidatus Omnitrophica bacterium]|nr:hypothetical protein [Candidatus Omnitrophota bacterium]
MKKVLLVIIFLFTCANIYGSELGEIRRVQSDAKRVIMAAYNFDKESTLELTHPIVIELIGGRESMEQFLDIYYQQLRSSNIKLLEFNFPNPPIFLESMKHEFVIIPTQSKVSVNDKIVESLNYQLGVRNIGNEKWHYIDGSQLNKKILLQWFPDFPADVELPNKEKKLL